MDNLGNQLPSFFYETAYAAGSFATINLVTGLCKSHGWGWQESATIEQRWRNSTCLRNFLKITISIYLIFYWQRVCLCTFFNFILGFFCRKSYIFDRPYSLITAAIIYILILQPKKSEKEVVRTESQEFVNMTDLELSFVINEVRLDYLLLFGLMFYIPVNSYMVMLRQSVPGLD